VSGTIDIDIVTYAHALSRLVKLQWCLPRHATGAPDPILVKA
jgi:hypothetical protein